MKLDSSEARLVRLVLERPGLTRHDLAQHMHTSVATVASLARSLTESGALVQDGSAVSTGGRPAAKLSVSPTLGHCYAHQVTEGRLASCALDARGKVLATVDRPVGDVAGVLRGVDAAEMELSVKVADRPPLASAVVVPGLVDRCSNTGVAPWLFGLEMFDPISSGCGSRLVSSAGSLIAMQTLRLGVPFTGRWVAIDMAGGLSGLLVTDKAETVPLEVAALDPAPELICKPTMEAAISAAAVKPTSSLGRFLKSMPATEALAAAEAEGDEEACRLFDSFVARTADFARQSCRVLRPRHLVLCSWLITSAGSSNRLRSGVARRVGMAIDDVTLVAPSEAIEHRWVGAGLAALDLRLADIEAGACPER